MARRGSAVGVMCVNWQQVCLGVAAAGRDLDVWITDEVMSSGTATPCCAPNAGTDRVRSKASRPIPAGRQNPTTSVTNQPD